MLIFYFCHIFVLFVIYIDVCVFFLMKGMIFFVCGDILAKIYDSFDDNNNDNNNNNNNNNNNINRLISSSLSHYI